MSVAVKLITSASGKDVTVTVVMAFRASKRYLDTCRRVLSIPCKYVYYIADSHRQSHTGHRPFQCEVCLQNFSEAATLQQHMRRHTQESELVSIRFNASLYRCFRHVEPYKCDYPECGKSFAITGALTIHKRMHNGHKPFKCKFCDKFVCASCLSSYTLNSDCVPRAFAESSNLSKHVCLNQNCTWIGSQNILVTNSHRCTSLFMRRTWM